MNVKQTPRLHRKWIDPHAYGIVRALQKAGHITYLVGGCVRDLLLGIQPKDFDIGTAARPEQVKRLIFRSFIIGKRFRLVLVKRDEQQFEVATFRREQPPEAFVMELPALGQPNPQMELPEVGEELEEAEDSAEGDESSAKKPRVTDNVYGTPEEDAQRRDFTINGLFYDPVAGKLIDYAQGLPDLNARMVRMIGDPVRRLAEDPIRILRALRLAHMIGFQLDPDLRAAMAQQAEKLPTTVLPRRREEFLKLIRLKDPALAFQEAYDLGVLKHISPHLHAVFDDLDRAEVFLSHLRHIHDFAVDKQNPLELFALLVLAYVRAVIQPDVTLPLKASEWEEHPFLLPLMRDELGMFKFEQSLIAKALHMQSTLQRAEEFAKRGLRRQLAVLRNEAFTLALILAERDYALAPKEVVFWRQSLEQGASQLARMPNDSRKRRRRRRRKVVETQMVDAGLVPTEDDTQLN
ncbi:MAG: poly(A) polymerase [Bdellovibrionales bacterium]